MRALADLRTAGRSPVVGLLVVLAFTVTAMALPASALAHTERASYWPDPAPDCSVDPCAGGEVPTPRSLASAVAEDRFSTRIVCQPNSLTLARRSIAVAQRTGYVLRPSLGPETITAARRPGSAGPQPQALEPLPLPLDPGRRERVRQQRPRRDHARALHRAGAPGRPRHSTPAAPSIRSRTTGARRSRFPTSISSIAPTTRT